MPRLFTRVNNDNYHNYHNQSVDYIAGIRITKTLGELSVGDLVAIMQEVITPLGKRIDTIEKERKDTAEDIESNI